MPPVIFLDLDGVLVDLHGPLGRIHGWGPWPAGEYSMERAFDTSAEEIWNHPEVLHPDFWADLPKLPWADRLVEAAIGAAGGDARGVTFLTLPVRDPACLSGKARWVARHYPRHALIVSTAPKRLLAAPGRALVDDSPRNVSEFAGAGGHGILFPRAWNELHDRDGDVDLVVASLLLWACP